MILNRLTYENLNTIYLGAENMVTYKETAVNQQTTKLLTINNGALSVGDESPMYFSLCFICNFQIINS